MINNINNVKIVRQISSIGASFLGTLPLKFLCRANATLARNVGLQTIYVFITSVGYMKKSESTVHVGVIFDHLEMSYITFLTSAPTIELVWTLHL